MKVYCMHSVDYGKHFQSKKEPKRRGGRNAQVLLYKR